MNMHYFILFIYSQFFLQTSSSLLFVLSPHHYNLAVKLLLFPLQTSYRWITSVTIFALLQFGFQNSNPIQIQWIKLTTWVDFGFYYYYFGFQRCYYCWRRFGANLVSGGLGLGDPMQICGVGRLGLWWSCGGCGVVAFFFFFFFGAIVGGVKTQIILL